MRVLRVGREVVKVVKVGRVKRMDGKEMRVVRV